MLRWTKLGGGQKEMASSANGSSSGPQVGPDGLTDQERQALEAMDRFYGMENVSSLPFYSLWGSGWNWESWESEGTRKRHRAVDAVEVKRH